MGAAGAKKPIDDCRLRDGDIIALDVDLGTLTVEHSSETLQSRPLAACDHEAHAHAYGRELFQVFRANVSKAELGASGCR